LNFEAGGVITSIIIVLNNLNNRPGNNFGFVGPRTITVTRLTQNAGSEKKEPSSGSYNYVDVRKELEKQSKKKKINIEVGHQIYILQFAPLADTSDFKNPGNNRVNHERLISRRFAEQHLPPRNPGRSGDPNI
jgi:hypothetical protein